jgi:hypothetical protein
MSQKPRWVLFSCTILASCVLMGQGCPAEMPLPGPVGPAGPEGPAGTMGAAGVSPFMTAANGTDIFYNLGNVGIGTNAPGARLDVRGDIRLGPAGEFNAVAGDGAEILRIIRGTVASDVTVTRGTGWTVARTAGHIIGDYTITYTTAFSGLPVVTATAIDPSALQTAVVSNALSNTTNRIRTFDAAGSLADTAFNFIAIGPR